MKMSGPLIGMIIFIILFLIMVGLFGFCYAKPTKSWCHKSIPS